MHQKNVVPEAKFFVVPKKEGISFLFIKEKHIISRDCNVSALPSSDKKILKSFTFSSNSAGKSKRKYYRQYNRKS